MIDDILKESWVYKEWRQEAEEHARTQDIISVVQARFASLTELAQERLKLLHTPQPLQKLIQLAQARDEEEAQQILLIKVKGNEQQ